MLAAALFAAGLYQAYTHYPAQVGLVGDDQLYFFVAERAASGVPPHLSLVDHKHQLTALLSAIPMRIGRSFGADDVVAGRVASMLAAAGTVALLFLLVERLTASVAAALIAAAVALHFRMFFSEAAMGYRPQLFMAFLATGALTAFARRWYGSAGALAAASFSCWQPAGLIGAALVAASIGERDWRRAIVRIAAGGLAFVAVYEGYFLWHGALAEQLRQSYLMASTGERVIRPLLESLVFIVSGDPRGWGWQPEHMAGLALLVLLAGGFLSAVFRPRTALRWWRRDPAWRAVTMAALGAIAFTLLDHQAYPDQFFILPFAAIAGGLAWHLVTRRLTWPGVRAALTIAALVWMTKLAVDERPTRPFTQLQWQRVLAKRMVDFADANGGTLWVVGRPELLALERRDNWSPFGMLLDRRVREYALTRMRSTSIRPLRKGRPPQVIVLARLASGQYLEWIRREYQNVEMAGFNARLRLMLRKPKPPAKKAAAGSTAKPAPQSARPPGVGSAAKPAPQGARPPGTASRAAKTAPRVAPPAKVSAPRAKSSAEAAAPAAKAAPKPAAPAGDAKADPKPALEPKAPPSTGNAP